MRDVVISGLAISPFRTPDDAVSRMFDDGNVRSGFWVAINAEKIMTLRKDKTLKALIDSATVRYADGITVVNLIKRKGVFNVKIAGCDLWLKVIDRCSQHGVPIFLVGGSSRVNQLVENKLVTVNGAKVVGSVDGFFDDEEQVINKIVHSKAKFVSVAMGSPKQEVFINKCREIYPEAMYMGVGGTFDVFVGEVKRAPKWMINYGVEWLYRLLKQPTRLKRQLTLLHFLFLVILRKI